MAFMTFSPGTFYDCRRGLPPVMTCLNLIYLCIWTGCCRLVYWPLVMTLSMSLEMDLNSPSSWL